MKRWVGKELMQGCLERRGHQTWNALWKGFGTQIVSKLNTK